MKRKIKVFLILCILALCIGGGVILHFQPQSLYVMSEYVGAECKSIRMKRVEIKNGQKISLDKLNKIKNVSFDQSMFLVNASHLIEEGTIPEISIYKDSGVQMNECLQNAYDKLSEAVTKETGTSLLVNSAYRSEEEQVKLFKEDPSTANAVGSSEHEMGLALDVCVPYFGGYGFLKTEAGKFVNSKCWEYGFIIRYPVFGKEETGVKYEPWHIRYVGYPHAKVIYNNQLTLEEYLESLEVGTWYQVEDYLISKQQLEDNSFVLPQEYSEVVISPDNMGAYIVTVKE